MNDLIPEVRIIMQLKNRIRELEETLAGIQRYGLDTLSGRVDGPDDREWQRAAVNEMTKRARLGLAGSPASLGGEPSDAKEGTL